MNRSYEQPTDDLETALHNLQAMIFAAEDGGLVDADHDIHSCYFRVMRDQMSIAQAAATELAVSQGLTA